MTRPAVRDWTGKQSIGIHSHVKIVQAEHKYNGATGTVVRIDKNRLWIAMPGGKTTSASNRSVRVVVAGTRM